MNNILLTGGAGYIGSHTALALHKAGYQPIVLDDLSHGHEWAVKYGPLVRGDMGDVELVRSICKEYQPVAMIHFAAFIEVSESVRDPTKYMNNNYRKAAKLFETAESEGIRHTVFSSTAAVYGTPQHDNPITENDRLAPINPYGESKLAAEKALRERVGISSVALRYFNAAGAAPESGLGEAHDPETHLIPNIILAGLGRKPALNIFGADYPTPDGTAIRDYIHVLDLASAHIAALEYLLTGGKNIACNLGTGNGNSVKSVISAAEKELGHEVPKNFHPRRAGDPPRLVADNALAKKLLNWSPRHNLSEIVSSAVAWHKQNMEKTNL
ncbi:MAG: UDP-glucose 4-epimerase GalE [Alphaproteobacteria bacterium]|nr:UDP-glucose 4-epimerase GalE [Alphaproteobacteria bacterium]